MFFKKKMMTINQVFKSAQKCYQELVLNIYQIIKYNSLYSTNYYL